MRCDMGATLSFIVLQILEQLPIKEVEERERIVRNNTSAIKHWGAFAGIAGASDKNAKIADWRSADASGIIRNGLRKMKALGLAGINLAQADAPPVLAIRWPSRVNRSNFEAYFSDDAPISDARSEWHNPEPFMAAFSSGGKPIPLVFVNAIVGGVTRACVVLIRKGKAHCEITAFAPAVTLAMAVNLGRALLYALRKALQTSARVRVCITTHSRPSEKDAVNVWHENFLEVVSIPTIRSETWKRLDGTVLPSLIYTHALAKSPRPSLMTTAMNMCQSAPRADVAALADIYASTLLSSSA
ncbi:uncharacterized protein ACA1_057000 [Acanthamoeba castellanii str. Neff]|uniref:Uncharacterized protein n=1 Tax=Acanthamoeba castellanii (strain ATCC 30010 / Neff) TaxID=1257118 RepID=L8GWX4_ACACF|nr:uncharacterized protein ACA1_057000 [Acanthamoeba castellanii str. Neff]ELR17068.1 hypothetical protein ACA1_057000 [Acanthamoeba castellanii str. Neff]